MSAGFAFLHHLAAFALVAGIVLQFVLIRDEITTKNAWRLASADMVVGLSAVSVLVVGLLRVFYFEKGAAFYLHNLAFLAKLALFLLVALLSIYPTLKFMAWRRGAPADPASVRRVKKILHLELAGIVLILLFAALMARGMGYYI